MTLVQSRRESIEQIEPTAVVHGTESKSNINHYEDIETGVDEKTRDLSNVQDSDAQGYVDPDLIIDEEENKRLRKIINWRYVLRDWYFSKRLRCQSTTDHVYGIHDSGS
jgi:hypothetical protein